MWHDISPGSNIPNKINVIVEIPKDSQNKYEYDKTNNVIRLDRVLYSPLHYQGDYGLIPQTLSDDGDPLDALVLMTNPTYPGILIEARPIALLRMEDAQEVDNKILCVAINDPRYASYKKVIDVEEHTLKEISHFFQVYKELEGKKVVIVGWGRDEEAKNIIRTAIDSYRKTFSNQVKEPTGVE